MRLAIDVGNTKTALGAFRSGRLERSWRVGTRHWTPDELGALVHVLLQEAGLAKPRLVCYACVVPQVRHALEGMSSVYCGCSAVEVTPGSSGLRIDYPRPGELGPDRLANAVAAISRGRLPAIVADFGTATTFDVIDSSGSYLGGAIAPGVGTAAAELFRKAERLNPVDLVFPEDSLGRSTEEAVRSGVLLGAAGAADRLVELLSGHLEGSPALLATGGWAAGLAPHCRCGFEVAPDLTLEGIEMIGARNQHGLAE